MLPVWYAVFLLSLTCHEAAHALVARRGGDDTAYRAGQVTLNPIPHVRREPFGTIVFPLLSFIFWTPGWMLGWASAPYDPSWEERHPGRAALMAAAGPAANVILAVVAVVLMRVGLETGFWMSPGQEVAIDRLVAPAPASAAFAEGLGRLVSVLLVLNLVLFLLNVIPVPPLDGAAIASGVVPALRSPYRALRSTWLGSLIGIVVATLVLRRAFNPVLAVVLRLVY